MQVASRDCRILIAGDPLQADADLGELGGHGALGAVGVAYQTGLPVQLSDLLSYAASAAERATARLSAGRFR